MVITTINYFRDDDLLKDTSGVVNGFCYCNQCNYNYKLFRDDDLLKDTSGGVNGFCNCNECEESNTTISGECPLQTEVCFHPDRYKIIYLSSS